MFPNNPLLEPFLIIIAKVILIPVIVLNLIPLLIWMERKVSAYIQDRRGPNRANILGVRLAGMILNFADVVKLLTKEEFFPTGANRFYFVLAPGLVFFIYVITTAIIPFADVLKIGEFTMSFQVADLNVGVLYLFSMASLAVYGVMLAGWSSNNKYSLLGGLRASSQMISYEITMGLSIVTLFMMSGSVSLNDIIHYQSENPLYWNMIQQPLAFILFLIATFAETNRNPFDLPEGESELVAGYHVEYSSMKFALFFMGEYAAIIVASSVLAALFLGGWQVPFLSTQALIDNAVFFLNVIGKVFGVVSILLGLVLMVQFRPGRYKDARDFEVLILGIPALAVGIFASYFFFTQGIYDMPDWAPPVFAASVQFVTFITKVILFCFFFIWVRWTLPRFRYDQLMSFGWKGMIPASLVNLFLVSARMMF
ncbi:MAG: NADH-quinone oxidoreductase subunit H [Deltaproteobacteria bacterium]|nr:MAG: NADH-quinone oxidoreductase subunit H [Deltaproteobacteria bacterium]